MPGSSGFWGADGPYAFASRRPAHRGAGSGGRNRNGPIGGWAYGIPKKARPVSLSLPINSPAGVEMAVSVMGEAMNFLRRCRSRGDALLHHFVQQTRRITIKLSHAPRHVTVRPNEDTPRRTDTAQSFPVAVAVDDAVATADDV